MTWLEIANFKKITTIYIFIEVDICAISTKDLWTYISSKSYVKTNNKPAQVIHERTSLV